MGTNSCTKIGGLSLCNESCLGVPGGRLDTRSLWVSTRAKSRRISQGARTCHLTNRRCFQQRGSGANSKEGSNTCAVIRGALTAGEAGEISFYTKN